MNISPPDPSQPPENWPEDTLLAVTLWGEARGESVDGIIAVASVILNRLKAEYRGASSIAKVVLRKWQFSCWNHDDPNAPKLRAPQDHDQAGWRKVCACAVLVLEGAVSDNTNGATHYCTKNLWGVPRDVNHPRWHDEAEIASGKTKLTAEIGNHCFARAL